MSSKLNHYFGDLHSHCAVGYGHGPMEDSLTNARLQLDFVAVTPHAHWHDMPTDDPRLSDVVAYHVRGFKATDDQWDHYTHLTDQQYQPGRFVTFTAFEWHSCRYGDHNVYFRDGGGEVIRAADLPALRSNLRGLASEGRAAMAIPHHIGYRAGYRGIAWDHFDPEFSPVVEAMSMHGAAAESEGPRPYLHTMGPRTHTSTYQYGLEQGHVVGFIGSSDHHSAHPGSYGHGRLAVLAPELTREAIWEAIWRRRTYALTGSNMRLNFTVDEGLIGDVLTPRPKRHISIETEGDAAIDTVELLHNNRLIERSAPVPAETSEGPFKVKVEVGWANRGEPVIWDAALSIVQGHLVGVEPQFRGDEIVAPEAEVDGPFSFSSWQRTTNGVAFTTRTWGNPTTTTAATQAVSLTVDGADSTLIEGSINGKQMALRLGALRSGAESHYLGGFLSPAVRFGQAVPMSDYRHRLDVESNGSDKRRDWYHMRVRQVDGQVAWSSPIWVEPSSSRS